MALRTRYSSLDMVRMAKFAKENPDLKPIPLIEAYNKKYPEISEEQKLKNIRNWLDDNGVMAVAESSNECATLPINSVMPRFLEKWFDSVRGYWICPKCKHKPIFAWIENAKSGDKHYCKHCKWTYEVP